MQQQHWALSVDVRRRLLAVAACCRLPPPRLRPRRACATLPCCRMSSDEAASVAVAVLFGLACIACVISKKVAGFKLYLLLGLSSAFRCIGFAARAAQLSDPTNTDLAAVSLVFRQVSEGAPGSPGKLLAAVPRIAPIRWLYAPSAVADC